jgi:hypothetical protein
MADERKRRLIIEFELPDFYCEDIPELLDEFGDPSEDRGDQILHEIGDISFGALTIEVSGEKDSVIKTVPVLARSARIEDEPPSVVDWLPDAMERLVERALDARVETAYNEGYDQGTADAKPSAREARP